jgi:multiple sugar transport system ATP-binding protein
MPFVDVPAPAELAGKVENGQMVIVGIRPDAFEDASLLEPAHLSKGVTFTAPVDVTEWLGNELYAYVPFDTHQDVEAALVELDRALDGEALRTQIVVNLDGASRIRQGDNARLWFDPAKTHVFDPKSGLNLTRSSARAAQIAADADAERRRQLSVSKLITVGG